MKKVLLGLALMLTACAGTTNIHGALIKPADVDKLRLGVHTKQDVVRLLGTPSTVSTLNYEDWYYITDITVVEPLKKPYLKERKIFALRFNSEGLLDHIYEKDETAQKKFKPSTEVTKTGGKEKGFVEGFFESLRIR